MEKIRQERIQVIKTDVSEQRGEFCWWLSQSMCDALSYYGHRLDCTWGGLQSLTTESESIEFFY